MTKKESEINEVTSNPLDIAISVQSEQQHGRIFQEIVVEYPSISTYPEYEGKPYFSIKYIEDGHNFIGYGTYKPEILSEYLKEYFMSPAQSDWGKPVGNGRPLADSEVIPRLQAIKVQIGGSYAIDRAIEVLEELQERPKGEWILKKKLVPLAWDCSPIDYDNYDEASHSELREIYCCSECGWESGEFKGGDFCPNCYADMKGKQDE